MNVLGQLQGIVLLSYAVDRESLPLGGSSPRLRIPHDERHVADALVAVPRRHLELHLQLLRPHVSVISGNHRRVPGQMKRRRPKTCR